MTVGATTGTKVVLARIEMAVFVSGVAVAHLYAVAATFTLEPVP